MFGSRFSLCSCSSVVGVCVLVLVLVCVGVCVPVCVDVRSGCFVFL